MIHKDALDARRLMSEMKRKEIFSEAEQASGRVRKKPNLENAVLGLRESIDHLIYGEDEELDEESLGSKRKRFQNSRPINWKIILESAMERGAARAFQQFNDNFNSDISTPDVHIRAIQRWMKEARNNQTSRKVPSQVNSINFEEDEYLNGVFCSECPRLWR
jgi:hypothetical protein